MTKSEAIAELAAALAKAQGAIKGAVKDSANPHFKSRYADLASVWDACREPLASNNLAVVQGAETADDGSVVVETMLMHASGQWVAGCLRMRPVKADPQGVGSAITYARRYALAAMVGVAPDDDDGEAASGRPQQAPGRPQQTAPNGNGSSSSSGSSSDRKAKLDRLIYLANQLNVDLPRIPALMTEQGVLEQPLPSNRWSPEVLERILQWFQEEVDRAHA